MSFLSNGFGQGGGGRRGGFGPEPDTELRALLIGESPLKNWGAYVKENERRRTAKLPLGNMSQLAYDDEGVWMLDMMSLGTETVEEGLITQPMDRSLFDAMQEIASRWGMGELVPHLWRDSWVCSTPHSDVPRFRFSLADKILYPARIDSMVDDFQRAQASIGIDPGKLIRPDAGMKERLRKGRERRAVGIYLANGHVNNGKLRKGQVGYPVILPPLDLPEPVSG